MDGGAWWAAVQGVTESWTWLSNFTFTFHFHALEKEMASHSSVLAWRIPGTEEPGRLPSMGSHRVGHDWSDLAAAAACSNLILLPKTCSGPLLLHKPKSSKLDLYSEYFHICLTAFFKISTNITTRVRCTYLCVWGREKKRLVFGS